jgi:D-aspartate ligase
VKIANVVLGAYINGYSIIQELFENKVENIYVLDIKKDISFYSNKIKGSFIHDHTPDSILKILKDLKSDYELVILYPNQDKYLDLLVEIHDSITDFCFIAFNPNNVVEYQDKSIQYNFCDQHEIPYPKTITFEKEEDLILLKDFLFPVLIKPTKRDNQKTDIFRTLTVNDNNELNNKKQYLLNFINNGYKFIVSEIIPGDGSNVFAYIGYRSRNGEILGEWTGKKLSQFPDDFGVFSSASNQAPEIVKEQGRKLLQVMDLWGVNEPEFKFDFRDQKYKLMEINLRPMMWHRTGAISGVPVNYIQYLDAINYDIPNFTQIKSKIYHYIYLVHEIINVLRRKGYLKIFLNNLFKGDKRFIAVFDPTDLKPFIHSFLGIWKRYKKYKKRQKDVSY